MVISKLTGRGCALSIAGSKAITEKLIDEGIVGKIVYVKRRRNSKNRCELFRVVEYNHDKSIYIHSQKSDKPPEGPLWTPSFIDADVWEQAVGKFLNLEGLDYNVETFLLPEMDEYLQGFSDAELISITKDFLIEVGVLNTPISQHGGKTYYFNEDEIYTLDENAERFPYEGRIKFSIFKADHESCFNVNVWRKAVSQFKVGATLEECVEIFLRTEIRRSVSDEPSSIERLIQRIHPPTYERTPENPDERTFDYIRITVDLHRYQFNSRKALQDEVKKYQSEIYQRVVQKIEGDYHFKKYEVPMDCLKPCVVILRHDFAIEYIFDRKRPEVELLPDVAKSL